MRVHIRHAGRPEFRFGIQKPIFFKGWNVYFFRWFMAIRYGKSEQKLWDMGFGRAQLKAYYDRRR